MIPVAEQLIVSLLRTIAGGAGKLKLKVYLPSIVVETLKKAMSKRTSQWSWSPISVSKVLSFLADMIE